jgi:hypothetical protein
VQLRAIARGHGQVGAEWRARWKAATKTGSPLFDGPTVDWNINQVGLVFWSTFYDNIFEHPERPDQRTIENDDLLDRWVEQKGKEIEERARKNSRAMSNPSSSAFDHQEVITFEETDEELNWLEQEEYEDEEVEE